MDDSLAPRLLDMRQEPSLASAAVLFWRLQQLNFVLCIKWTVWNPTGLNPRDYLGFLKVLRMFRIAGR